MTALLQEVIKRAESLPETEQNMFASEWLIELESERKWDVLFATTDDQLRAMVDGVKADIAAGRTHPMEAMDVVEAH